MKKALILTVAQTEELPTPLNVRLMGAGGSQPLQFSLRKGEEVPCDVPLRLEFCYTGAVLGFLHFQLPAITEPQSKWLSLGFPEEETQWKDLETAGQSGPRVLIALEPVRPLSPIIETTENSDCSLSLADSRSVSPGEEHHVSVLELQQERESNIEKQRELQLKVMELKQILGKEAWRFRCTLEQMDRRYKTEIGHLVILMEKAKAVQIKDSGIIADLSSKLKTYEGKESNYTVSLEVANKRAEAAETECKSLEIRLKETIDELAVVKITLQTTENQLKSVSEELLSVKSTLKSVADGSKLDRKTFKSVLHEKESQDLRQTISSLQSALTLCRQSVDDKDREIRHLSTQYDSLKAKSSVYESTLSTLKASTSVIEKPDHSDTTVPDLIDDMLKAYIQTHPDVTIPLIRVSEGQYSIGNKKVFLTVRNGGLVIRVGGGFMVLDEFLKIYGGNEQSFRTPRRRLGRKDEETRSQSLGLERHHRSVGTAGDITRRTIEDQENVGGVTDRMGWKQNCGRETSPKPVYWRETVSSHNKVTAKGAKPHPETRAVREGLILRDL